MADPSLAVSPEHALSDDEVSRQALIAARNEIAALEKKPRQPGKGWFSPMSPVEKAAQAAFLGLGATDWGQTIRFTQDPAYRNRGVYEQNPILGRHPSRAKVNLLVPLGLAAHTLGVWALPRPYRNILQVAGIASEGNAVRHNNMPPQWPWK